MCCIFIICQLMGETICFSLLGMQQVYIYPSAAAVGVSEQLYDLETGHPWSGIYRYHQLSVHQCVHLHICEVQAAAVPPKTAFQSWQYLAVPSVQLWKCVTKDYLCSECLWNYIFQQRRIYIFDFKVFQKYSGQVTYFFNPMIFLRFMTSSNPLYKNIVNIPSLNYLQNIITV